MPVQSSIAGTGAESIAANVEEAISHGTLAPGDALPPIRELAARAGLILLIGVGLNRMTALHLAEQQSGRRLFLRWARGADGQPSMFEVGSCSEGFPRLEPALHPHARTAVVGGSRWRAYPARQTLATATTAITEDQGITRCASNDCLLCRDSIAGGPIETPAYRHRHSRMTQIEQESVSPQVKAA